MYWTSLVLFLAALLQADPARPSGVTVNTEGAFPGYTLYSPLLSKTVYLIDMEGKIVHEWQTEHAPGNSVYLKDNGNLVRCVRVEDNPVFHGGGIGGRVQEFTWDGELVWDYTFSTEEQMSHHDIELLPNGNVLFIVWEKLFEEDARALGRDPAALASQGLWPDGVVEIEPVLPSGGRIVWEWHAWDHLIQDFDEEKAYFDSIPDHPGRIDINADHRDQPPITQAEREAAAELEEQMRALGYVGGEDDEEDDQPTGLKRRSSDWLHTNSIDYHPELDLIVLSTPRLNEMWIIDHSTTTEEAASEFGGRWGKGGALLYRWGNPRTYGAGDRPQQKLFAQHDAQWVEAGHPGTGNILVFNNGGGRPGGNFSSVNEIVPPFDPERGFVRQAGQAFGPKEPIWSYSDPENERFYAAFISGCQRLPNGNTLICSGPQGRLFEVTPEKEIVWEYWNPHGGEVEPSFGRAGGGGGGGVPPVALFRGTRLSSDHPGLSRL